MNRTSIEWVRNPDGSQGYTWNPITGCLNGCPYCYARKLANGRLKQRYLDNHWTAAIEDMTFSEIMKTEHDPFYPRFWPERFDLVSLVRSKPRGIFVCDMGELFGDWIPEQWIHKVMANIRHFSQHRFYLLTKQPQNLVKWSPFPENCWVGVTATNPEQYRKAIVGLASIKSVVKYISFEPLLKYIPVMSFGGLEIINWPIIGAMTGSKIGLLQAANKIRGNNPPLDLALMPYGKIWTLQPKLEWVKEIVIAADKVGIPVFLKDNLKPLYIAYTKSQGQICSDYILRQEMPK